MAKRHQIYKCTECGNIIDVVTGGMGELICCGQPMELLDEKTADAATEKHVPVIEKTDAGYKVKVGSVPHPMEEKHYIEWVELIADGRACRQFLKPGDVAEAVFCSQAGSVTAREHCNVHGLWRG